MSMKVEVKDGNFQITIPVKEAYANKPVQNLLNILRAQEILAHSRATEEQIEELSEEVNASWWEENKGKYLNGPGD